MVVFSAFLNIHLLLDPCNFRLLLHTLVRVNYGCVRGSNGVVCVQEMLKWGDIGPLRGGNKWEMAASGEWKKKCFVDVSIKMQEQEMSNKRGQTWRLWNRFVKMVKTDSRNKCVCVLERERQRKYQHLTHCAATWPVFPLRETEIQLTWQLEQKKTTSLLFRCVITNLISINIRYFHPVPSKWSQATLILLLKAGVYSELSATERSSAHRTSQWGRRGAEFPVGSHAGRQAGRQAAEAVLGDETNLRRHGCMLTRPPTQITSW